MTKTEILNTENSLMIKKKTCGIVMPISEIDGCSPKHWEDVYDIISDAAEKADLDVSLVSEGSEVGVIHKRIVQNLYFSDIVICDVSRKNPNVMFELGIRLAFDKPVVIIKDEKTNYSFDTSPIEHLSYPSDLRFQSIIQFKDDLTEKIGATLHAAESNKNYSPFLGHFGDFKTVQIDAKVIDANEFLFDEIRQMRVELARLASRNGNSAKRGFPKSDNPYVDICLARSPKDEKSISALLDRVRSSEDVESAALYDFGSHAHVKVDVKELDEIEEVRSKLEKIIKSTFGARPVRIRR